MQGKKGRGVKRDQLTEGNETQNKEAKACQEERRTLQQERDEDKEIRIKKSNYQINLAPFREVTRDKEREVGVEGLNAGEQI